MNADPLPSTRYKVCLERNLIVELDGGIHNLKQDTDAVRDATLQILGYRVLRITNDELMRDLPAVLQAIQNAL